MTFDLGGVLVDWDPRYLYRKLLASEAEVERFLSEICTQAWNLRQDAGRPVAEAVAELAGRFPEHRALIDCYYRRFGEMIGGLIDDNVALVRELAGRGVPLYALSNFSAETFGFLEARPDAGFLALFRGVVLSGREGVVKPEPRIFEILCERYRLAPADVLFIDDVEANAEGARRAGLAAIAYRPGMDLRGEISGWLEDER